MTEKEKLLAIKERVRERIKRRAGYRNIGVSRDPKLGPRVLIDIEADADPRAFDDVVGINDGVHVTLRQVTGTPKAAVFKLG